MVWATALRSSESYWQSKPTAEAAGRDVQAKDISDAVAKVLPATVPTTAKPSKKSQSGDASNLVKKKPVHR
jgi:hypothetical protein